MPVNKLCRICVREDKEQDGMQPLFDAKNARCAEIVRRIEECGGIVVGGRLDKKCFIILKSLIQLINMKFDFYFS